MSFENFKSKDLTINLVSPKHESDVLTGLS